MGTIFLPLSVRITSVIIFPNRGSLEGALEINLQFRLLPATVDPTATIPFARAESDQESD